MHILFSLLCRKVNSVNRAKFTLRFGAFPLCLGFAPCNHRLQPSYLDRNSDGWQKGFTNVPPGLRAIQPIAMSKCQKCFLAASAMPRIWYNIPMILRENSRAYALLINFGRPSLQYDTFDLDKLPSVSLLDTSVSCGEAAPQKSSIDCEV